MTHEHLLAIAVAVMPLCALDAQQPLLARRDSTQQTYFGVRVADPYRWLERLDAPDTRAWVQSQDSAARRWLASPARDSIRARVARLAASRAQSPPTQLGDYFMSTHFATTGGSAALLLYVRKGADGRDRELVLTSDGGSRPLRRVIPANVRPIAAFGISMNGGSWQEWGFVDLATARVLADTLRGLHQSAGAAWSADDRALYYTRFRVPPPESLATARIAVIGLFRHRLGAPQRADSLIYTPPSPSCFLTPNVPAAGGLVLVRQVCDGTTTSLIAIPSDGVPFVVAPARGATYRFVGRAGTDTYWQTDDGAPNHKVVRLRVNGRSAEWATIVPEDTLPLYAWAGSPLGANLIGRSLVLAYQKDATPLVKVFDLEGAFQRMLTLPEVGPIWSGFVGTERASDAFYSVSGVASSGTIYRIDPRTGTSTVWSRPAIDLPLDSIVTTQVFVRSKDGTRFPMFVVRRIDTPLDGTAPAWIYGYGFGHWSAAPWFQPHVADFVNRGGVWALPNIRGGGEYGETWSRAGSRAQKMTTVDDYIAATEFLISGRYTSARRIVANASSAGGVVAAAAVLRRPELYGAAILDFPVLDMLRYHLFTVAGTWKDEYGTVDDESEFGVLRGLSAPHNLRSGVCYPPVLVAPGENDQVTPPFHAYKFVAALQHDKGCNTFPALLRMSWGAGHNFGRTANDVVDNWTDQLLFVEKALQPTRHSSRGTLPEVVRRGRGAQPMVLIPCASCRWRSFEPFMERHANDFTMYAVTLPGEGGTRAPELPFAGPGSVWFDNAVDALSRLIDREHLRDVIVVGHSFGASIAVQLANRRADRIAAAVNLDGRITNPPAWDAMSREEREELARGALLQYGENVFFDADQWQSFNQTGMPDAERAKLYHGWFMATPRDVVMQYWREGITTNLNALLRGVRVPLLDIKTIAPNIANQDSAKTAYTALMDSVGVPTGYRRLFLERTRHFFIEDATAADDAIRELALRRRVP